MKASALIMYVTILAHTEANFKKKKKAVCKKEMLQFPFTSFSLPAVLYEIFFFFVSNGFSAIGYQQDLCENCHGIN